MTCTGVHYVNSPSAKAENTLALFRLWHQAQYRGTLYKV